ncbi:MAG TPA: hypothetical protein VJR23_03530 [Candidatus Acidoferrales bacterium]|nr:hypothetical protein [Candidatus Acidoferrales bacterium]
MGASPSADVLEKQTGLSMSDAENAVAASMFLASAVSSPEAEEGTEKLADDLMKGKLIEPSDRVGIAGYIEILRDQRASIRGRLDRAQLASRILPAFAAAHSAVDVRVDLGEKRIAVPVGLLHITTDESDSDIHFQVSAPQLAALIKRLQDLQSQMQVVEKLAQTWEKTKE